MTSEKKKAYDRAYRERNREYFAAYQRRYYAAHAEEIKRRMMEHADEHLRYMQNRYRTLKEKGMCVVCARTPARAGRTMCAECAVKTSEASKRSRMRRIL